MFLKNIIQLYIVKGRTDFRSLYEIQNSFCAHDCSIQKESPRSSLLWMKCRLVTFELNKLFRLYRQSNRIHDSCTFVIYYCFIVFRPPERKKMHALFVVYNRRRCVSRIDNHIQYWFLSSLFEIVDTEIQIQCFIFTFTIFCMDLHDKYIFHYFHIIYLRI